MAESLVDSYKTELISDRVWRSKTQVELATVAWVAWFNHDRLHSSLGDIPPTEYEQNYYAEIALNESISANGSVALLPSKPANGLTTRRGPTISVDFAGDGPISPESAPDVRTTIRSGRDNASQETNGPGWPLRPVVNETYSLTGTSKPTTPTTEKPT